MSFHRSAALSVAVISAALAAAATRADAQAATGSNGSAVEVLAQSAAVDVARFVPGAVAAQAGTPAGTGSGWGGYDGATRTPLVGAAAEVRLGTRIVIGAGATYASRDKQDPAELRPSVSVRAQILDQASHGVDMGAAAAYRQDRFVTEEGLLQGTLSMGIHGDVGTVLVSLGYGQDGEGDDHLGDARLIAFRHLGGTLHLGFDSHVQWLFDSTDPNRVQHATPSIELTVAPAMSYGIGPIMLLLEVGWSGVDLAQFQSGVLAVGGIATSF